MQVTNQCNSLYYWNEDAVNKFKYNFVPNVSSNLTYLWNFGDGTNSTLTTPDHIFPGNGTYTICLMITKGTGIDTCKSETCYPLTIGCKGDFYYNTGTGNKWKINFAGSSNVTGTQYNWDFGNGVSDTGRYASVTYAAIGAYNVCLTIHSTTDSTCSNTTCHTINIEDTVDCRSKFTATQDSINPSHVAFVNTSWGNNLRYLWDFGDGDTSTLKNPPVHVYDSLKKYIVCLWVQRNDSVQCMSSTCDSFNLINTGLSAPEKIIGQVKLYPNPVDERLEIEWNGASLSRLHIIIYDILGKEYHSEVLAGTTPENHFQINTSDLPKGIYIVKLSANGVNHYRRLIK